MMTALYGIPFVDDLALRHLRAVASRAWSRRTGRRTSSSMRLSWSRTLTTPLRPETTIRRAVVVGDLDHLHAFVLQLAVELRLHLRLRRDEAGRAAGVERAQGQLRARLADGLRGDDARPSRPAG